MIFPLGLVCPVLIKKEYLRVVAVDAVAHRHQPISLRRLASWHWVEATVCLR